MSAGVAAITGELEGRWFGASSTAKGPGSLIMAGIPLLPRTMVGTQRMLLPLGYLVQASIHAGLGV